ncbi:MAG TPA: hypothetical protein PK393_06150 [Synergistaceae bacterium]|nr:hypothetical protein [Synergistaceae bacterium]HQF92272.1 hypothetical protein [Synergistaceae bacterium]HQK25086.1 hypothetical protein [Synergistaceae bacterium]
MPTKLKDPGPRRAVYRIIRDLPPEDVEKVASYAAFLAQQRRLEDEEDLHVARERRSQDSLPLRKVLQEMGIA